MYNISEEWAIATFFIGVILAIFGIISVFFLIYQNSKYAILERKVARRDDEIKTTRERELKEKKKNKAYRSKIRILQKDSITDGLTGLGNQRAFNRSLNLETKRAKRHNHKLCLLFIDLNSFKQVNDLLGHQTGDEVLKKVSSVIADEIRLTDIACRPGGDEFAILLPETNLDDTVELVQRLTERTEEIETKLNIPSEVSFGVSIGGADYVPEMRISELVKLADEAMYIAKEESKK